MPIKKTIEEVRRKIEEKGFKLLSDHYENSLTKLDILCPIHGATQTSFKWLQKGNGCKKCGLEKRSLGRKMPMEAVRGAIENMGYTLLSKEYKNEDSVLLVSCPRHGEFKTKWGLIKTNRGCKKCGYERLGQKTRTKIEDIRERAKKLGYGLLTAEYVSWDQKLDLKCEIHGIFQKPLYSLNSKLGRCPKCGSAEGVRKNTKSQEVFESQVKNLGYEPVGQYEKSHKKVSLKCKKHGEFQIVPSDLLGGHGCQKCASTFSKGESEVCDFVKSLCDDTISNTRSVIGPLEIDIYVPSMRLAIEYCGLRWHSEDFRYASYHSEKMEKCNREGVRLITIFEDEWINKKEQIKGFLQSVLQKNVKTIYARKCEVREVVKEDATKFLQSNHIQGAVVHRVAFGLYAEDELMGLITGSGHHRQGSKNDLILSRLVFKSGVSVIGGASKLLKRLILYAKSSGNSKIVSWSDNRWSEGKVYQKMGFELTKKLGPDYSYVYRRNRISKQSCQKRILAKKGAIGNTEREMAKSLGYTRIWDCGKKRWEIELI